jgi:hypothetical protein
VEFSDLQGTISEVLHRVGVSRSEVNLVYDLRGLAEGDTPSAVAAMLQQLPQLDGWRTFTLAGTSFPQNLMGLPPSECSAIPRNEWQIWRGVCRNLGTRRRIPTFGDYAIAHPEPAEVDPRIMRPSASVRYTIDESWLVVKARNLRDHGYVQFHQMCRDLIGRPEYSGPSFSWGDGYIADCASRTVGTGNLTTWRKVGTSHHLRYVIDELSK